MLLDHTNSGSRDTQRVCSMGETHARGWMVSKENRQPNELADRIVWRQELEQKLGEKGVSTRTMARYIVLGKVPPPDVYLSPQRMGWRLSTLMNAGLGGICS